MEAMILAAGPATRLRPLSDRVPKALIEVGGRPLLAHVLSRLVEAGASHIIVNTHHHEDQISAFLNDNTPDGVHVTISPEPDGPYDTGGGLFAAAPYFRERDSFLLHNVDVLSNIPLGSLLADHRAARSHWNGRLIASLAVQKRETNRQLLFDSNGLLGWENRGADGAVIASRQVREPVGELARRAFTGVHVLEPSVFDLSSRKGSFSTITLYLELAAQGWVTLPADVSDCEWIDVGTPERLEEARARSSWL